MGGNAENEVGLMAMGGKQVQCKVTLTRDNGRFLMAMD